MSLAHLVQEPQFGSIVNAQTHQAVQLAMQRLHLAGKATPAGALLQVTHAFQCAGDATQPLEALYVFMLPRDGALRRFKIKGDGFEVESSLKPREEARKEYEENTQKGHLSSLAEVCPDGMVTLTIGQIRPGEEIQVILEVVAAVDTRDSDFRFRFPFTLAPNYHPQAKMTATQDGGKIELPTSLFGDLILPEWKSDPSGLGLHQVSFNLTLEGMGKIDTVGSPSHQITTRIRDDGVAEVSLAGLGSKPNCDLVIDIRSRETVAGVFADEILASKVTSPEDPKIPKDAPRWTVCVPSSLFPKAVSAARKVVFVLDRSGSMQNLRIERAKVALKAALSALAPTDEFGLVSFNYTPTLFHDILVQATDANRVTALQFIDRIQAEGGTELEGALAQAVQLLNNQSGDIFLLTDGEVAGTGFAIESMAVSTPRVHILGIGDASQDRFLASLARRTGGIQRMVGASEDVIATGMELFNAVRQPRQELVRAAVLFGKGKKAKIQDHHVPVVWEGRPVLITDNGQTGEAIPIRVEFALADGTTVECKTLVTQPTANGLMALLWAGRKVSDLDSALDMSQGSEASRKLFEAELKEVSTLYGIASRVMSLSAVVKRVGDQAGLVMAQQVVPVGMPGEMVGQNFWGQQNLNPIGVLRCHSPSLSFSGPSLGGASRGLGSTMGFAPDQTQYSCNLMSSAPSTRSAFRGAGATKGITGQSLGMGFDSEPEMRSSGPLHVTVPVNLTFPAVISSGVGMLGAVPGTEAVFSILGTLQADGGLPGADPDTRFVKTAAFALAVLWIEVNGAVRLYASHLRRMADFLDGCSGNQDKTIMQRLTALLRAASLGVSGNWTSLYDQMATSGMDAKTVWKQIRAAL